MAFLSQAPRLEGLLPSHGAFQGHAAHLMRWSMRLSPNGSRGTCIPQGLATFLHAAFTAHRWHATASAGCLSCRQNSPPHPSCGLWLSDRLRLRFPSSATADGAPWPSQLLNSCKEWARLHSSKMARAMADTAPADSGALHPWAQ